nr:MAG: hypothetical protein DiTV3a_F5ORF2 [Diabrotica toursvirus 3a]
MFLEIFIIFAVVVWYNYYIYAKKQKAELKEREKIKNFVQNEKILSPLSEAADVEMNGPNF